MKNHEWVNGKLLQTNKKYSQLKLKQKEKIHEWMYAAFRDSFRRTGKFPDKKEDDEILDFVMQKIENAEIWIPWYEVEKHYKGVKSRLNKRYKKEKARTLMQNQQACIDIEPLDVSLSVCKVENYSGIDISKPFCFTGSTDEEHSLVCPTDMVPDNTTARDDGWKAFRIVGVLDFSLIGILAKISKILATNEIGIFAISTYNTDYILTKEERFDKALEVLRAAGYRLKMKEERAVCGNSTAHLEGAE